MASLLFGRFIRGSWILIFVLGGILIPHSLELFIKNPLNFFSIFIHPHCGGAIAGRKHPLQVGH
ncbi:MAG: hypothetical protein WAU70_13700 [Flavobacteriales bacterium]